MNSPLIPVPLETLKDVLWYIDGDCRHTSTGVCVEHVSHRDGKCFVEVIREAIKNHGESACPTSPSGPSTPR